MTGIWPWRAPRPEVTVPTTRTNIDHNHDKVDCHWSAHDLTIELVSYRYHATRHGFETDIARRRRSKHLACTSGDIIDRDARSAAELRPLLA